MIIDQKTKRESLTTPKPAVSVTVSPNWKKQIQKIQHDISEIQQSCKSKTYDYYCPTYETMCFQSQFL